MRRHYDVNGVKILFVCLFASQKINHHRRLTRFCRSDDRHKNGQFGKGGSTCLWMGLLQRNSGALSCSLLDFSIPNIIVLST